MTLDGDGVAAGGGNTTGVGAAAGVGAGTYAAGVGAGATGVGTGAGAGGGADTVGVGVNDATSAALSAPFSRLVRMGAATLPEKNSGAVRPGSADGAGGKISAWKESACDWTRNVRLGLQKRGRGCGILFEERRRLLARCSFRRPCMLVQSRTRPR